MSIGSTLCLLGNFACIFVVYFFFQNDLFLKNSFRTAIRLSNSLDPDQSVGPDLGPNCFQRLSADDTSRQRVDVECKYN